MPPLEQLLYRPETSRIATSDHDPEMSYSKTLEEDPPNHAPPIAITSTSDPSLLNTTTNAGKQHGDGNGNGVQGTPSASTDLLGLDMSPPTDHFPVSSTSDGQDPPGNERPNESDVAADAMESSVATLKPSKPQYLTINTTPYVDPTPPHTHLPNPVRGQTQHIGRRDRARGLHRLHPTPVMMRAALPARMSGKAPHAPRSKVSWNSFLKMAVVRERRRS